MNVTAKEFSIDGAFVALSERRWLDRSSEFNQLLSSYCTLLTDVDLRYLPGDRHPSFKSALRRISQRAVPRQKDQSLWEDVKMIRDILEAYSKNISRDDQLIRDLLRSVRGIQLDLSTYPSRAIHFHKSLIVREKLVEVRPITNGVFITDYEIEKLTSRGEALLDEMTSHPEKGSSRINVSASTVVIGNVDKLGGGPMTNQNVTVTGSNITIGDVVAAETIQTSFNKVQSSQLCDDLKKNLESLHSQIDKLAKQLPGDKARQVAGDLDAFTKEVTSSSPRRKW